MSERVVVPSTLRHLITRWSAGGIRRPAECAEAVWIPGPESPRRGTGAVRGPARWRDAGPPELPDAGASAVPRAWRSSVAPCTSSASHNRLSTLRRRPAWERLRNLDFPQRFPCTPRSKKRAACSEKKAPLCGTFAEPSDGLEPSTPPYHGTSQATGGSRWQFSLVCADFGRRPFATDCHRLQPLGSRKAPSPRPHAIHGLQRPPEPLA